jgi:predicted transcriptional regulator of viral defense system
MSQKVYTFCDIREVCIMIQSIDSKVISKIYGKKRGWVFTTAHFFDLGSRTAAAKALERLANSGTIRRLAYGLYDYPEKHSVLGELPANYERIAQALAGRDSLKIQPSGAYAANLLGLTEQVPARIVFLTDGANRKVLVKNQQIVLKRTTPKNMATAGNISGLIIQALRYLGKNHVDDKTIGALKKRLTGDDKRRLMRDIRYAPAWIGAIFRQLQE